MSGEEAAALLREAAEDCRRWQRAVLDGDQAANWSLRRSTVYGCIAGELDRCADQIDR